MMQMQAAPGAGVSPDDAGAGLQNDSYLNDSQANLHNIDGKNNNGNGNGNANGVGTS